MPIENKIEIVSWVIAAALLCIGVPKHKYREAQVSFFFMQTLTWGFWRCSSRIASHLLPGSLLPSCVSNKLHI